MAFDDATGDAVLFGGTSGDVFLGDTWTFDGTAWSPRGSWSPINTNCSVPSPRSEPAMAYDAGHQEVVLFGGFGLGGPCPGRTYTFLNDTRTWDGSQWTDLNPADSPSGREGAAMAYDAATGAVVLFGGVNNCGDAGCTFLDDTWTWDGSDWTQQAPTGSPPAQANASMAYDADRQEVVLVGGGVQGGPAETWTWDGSDWNEQTPAHSPPCCRQGASTAYDAATGTVLLFGGCCKTADGDYDDTWTWDGSDWTQQSPAHSPPARDHALIAYDSIHQDVILFGGQLSSGLAGDWWTWDGTDWTEQSPGTNPSSRSSPSLAYDEARQDAVLFGGGEGNTTWTWDEGQWTPRFPDTSPTGRYGQSMAYDAADQRVVLFGGAGCGGECNDTWTWDGTNWTHETQADSPPAREFASMAYDPTSQNVVLFGGQRCTLNPYHCVLLGDTWLWDGTNWSPQTPAHSPDAREEAQMATDSAAGKVVLFGGDRGWADSPGDCPETICSDTWTWDGSDWTLRDDGTSSGQGARDGASMAYDPVTQTVVLWGGETPAGANLTMWSWDGTGWTQLFPEATPPGRLDAAMVFDSNGVGLLFGGWDYDPGPDGSTWMYGPKPSVVQILGKDGGTVATPDALDSTHPITTTVTLGPTDNGGMVSIAQIPSTNTAPPGFAFLDAQAVIAAPKGSAESPLTLAFTLDPSLVSSDPGARVHVFRREGAADPVEVASCATPGVLAPDPCVSSESTDLNGTVQITVMTTSASTWSFALPGVSLTVTKAGTGAGTVTSDPWGVSCGSVCRAGFPSGTPATLTAAPAIGSTFVGWSGACSGTGTCQVTMSRMRSVTATFVRSFALTVSKTGSGAGTVTSSPAGISCGPACSASFTDNTLVTLSAAPALSSVFAGWSGDCLGAGACQITMTANHAATAKFVHRPDAKIKLDSDSSYLGGGIYSTTASNETRTVKAKRTVTKTFDIALQNRGNRVDGFKLKGLGSGTKFTVKYLAGLSGTTDITAAVEAGTYALNNVAAGGTRYIRMRITVKGTASVGSTFGRLVTATSTHASTAKDAVKGVVNVASG